VNNFQEAPWQAIANGVAALANEGRYTVDAQSCGEIWNECGGDGLAGAIWLCNDVSFQRFNSYLFCSCPHRVSHTDLRVIEPLLYQPSSPIHGFLCPRHYE